MAPHVDEGMVPSEAPTSISEPFSDLLGGPVRLNGLNGLESSHASPAAVIQAAPTTTAFAVAGSDSPRSNLDPGRPGEVLDLVCVGFGPASLAVAVALHDQLESGTRLLPETGAKPKVLFLEKQNRFAWHAGMLLPGAKMQISFLKDMATFRNPRSHFTFLNYLHLAGRLVEFTNLGTFLPSRVEYEDYLRWCASHFDDVVEYQREVVAVSPDRTAATTTAGGAAATTSSDSEREPPVKTFTVTSRDAETGQTTTVRARNVLIAIGGQPLIPKIFPAAHPRVVHSSQYAHLIPKLLKDPSAPYRVAVVGAGQSAAEIFHNVQRLYPNSKTWLVMRSEFLKPSDDSPFVNSIFNPSYTDSLFPRSQQSRRVLIESAKATNYGVVRLDLIEHLYETMYDQRRTFGPDERQWPHRIMGRRDVVGVKSAGGEGDGEGDELRLQVRRIEDGPVPDTTNLEESSGNMAGLELDAEEFLDVDLVITATGYQRNAHVDMLRDSWSMLPKMAAGRQGQGLDSVDGWEVHEDGTAASVSRKLQVGRDYRVKYNPGTVASGSGIWLQGCCESTHGLSDTLLSVLATRSSEIVESIFKPETAAN